METLISVLFLSFLVVKTACGAPIWETIRDPKERASAIESNQYSLQDKIALLEWSLRTKSQDAADSRYALFRAAFRQRGDLALTKWAVQLWAEDRQSPEIFWSVDNDQTLLAFVQSPSVEERLKKETGDEYLPLFITLVGIKDRSEEIRVSGIRALIKAKRIKGDGLLEMQHLAANESNPVVRAEALWALASAAPQDPKLLPGLLEVLSSDSPEARKIAVLAAGYANLDDPNLRKKTQEVLAKDKGMLVGPLEKKRGAELPLLRFVGREAIEASFSNDKSALLDFKKTLAQDVARETAAQKKKQLSVDFDNLPLLDFYLSGVESNYVSEVLNKLDPEGLLAAVQDSDPAFSSLGRSLAKHFLGTKKNLAMTTLPYANLREAMAGSLEPKPGALSSGRIALDQFAKLLEEGDPAQVSIALRQFAKTPENETPENSELRARLWEQAGGFLLAHLNPNLEDAFLEAFHLSKARAVGPQVKKALYQLAIQGNQEEVREGAAYNYMRYFPADPASIELANDLLSKKVNDILITRLIAMHQGGASLDEIHWQRIADHLAKTVVGRHDTLLLLENAAVRVQGVRPLLAQKLMPLLPESTTKSWQEERVVAALRRVENKSRDPEASEEEKNNKRVRTAEALNLLTTRQAKKVRIRALKALRVVRPPKEELDAVQEKILAYAEGEEDLELKSLALQAIQAHSSKSLTQVQQRAIALSIDCAAKMNNLRK
jgi:hypothetical protein